MDMDHRKLSEQSNAYDLNSKIMLTAVLSLSFVILLVIILHIYARCVLRHPSPRSLSDFARPEPTQIHPEEPAPHKPGLDPAVISSLPSFLITKSDGQECVVCLSTLEEDDLARRLPNCNHVFHAECIDTWLTAQPTCPICRIEITPRLVPLEREPPTRGGDDVEVVVMAAAANSEVDCNVSCKINNGSSSSTSSSSFRLSSFRRMLGRERSSSSRRIQVLGDSDLERQTSLR
uniref:RING-type E3 ubiquitin transferase n=1 Tax=Opuntia streptacantha TaxID=393608 RepID=A0A7C8ZD05_OPUST